MTQSDLIIIRVMGRRTFHGSRSESYLDIFITDDRQYVTVGRIDAFLAYEMIELLILWMNYHAHITVHRFRSGRSDIKSLITVDNFIAEVIHLAFDVFMDDFDVTERGLGDRIPVDDSFTLIDQTFLIVIDEYLGNGFGKTFIKGKTFLAVIY